MSFTREILSKAFIRSYSERPVHWGFGALSELTYARTYARNTPQGGKERWHQCLERVVNGAYQLKHEHMQSMGLPIDLSADTANAQEMYDRMFHFKITPPGRGLWVMGSTLTTHPDRSTRLYAALNNCSFVSTANLANDLAKPFTFAMDSLMLGIGLGADLKGAGKITVHAPHSNVFSELVIADSRQGWVSALEILLESYFLPGKPAVLFNYDEIRPAGLPIKGFGGTSSGAKPLQDMLDAIRSTLDKNIGKPITQTTLADIINLIGRAVIAGNVRRSAQILLSDDSDEFLSLKDWQKRPERNAFSWASNNSVLYEPGKTDLHAIAEKILLNGEPGLIHLENMRQYARVNGVRDMRDTRVAGVNPCSEQQLESYELCCLVETFPAHHDSLDDFKRSQELAFEYAKIVTLGQTHWPETNAIMLRNRRIGCSLSGIAQFISKFSVHELERWCLECYDHLRAVDTRISEELCVRESVRITSIKPSGSVSLLAGASAGIHFSQAKHYIRRVRLASNHDLVSMLQAAGIHVEPSVTDPYTVVAEFPIESVENKFVKDISMWEQLALIAMIQRTYADNAVSATVTFDQKKETAESIAAALEYFMPQLKCVSMLPLLDVGNTPYAQMPLETIDEAAYLEKTKVIKPLILDSFYGPPEDDDENARRTIVMTAESYGVRGNPLLLHAKKTKLVRHLQKAMFIDEVEEKESVFLEMPESEQFCSGDRCAKA